MKKVITSLLATLTGLAIVACNSGGSSNNGGSDNNTPIIPTDYSESIPNGGVLISMNNLQIASNATNSPLNFGVQNITTDTTVDFTVSPAVGVSGSVPTISPQSCSFTFSNPQPCQISLNTANAPVGKYVVTPSVSSTNLSPINITTATPSTVTLPDGTYTASGDGFDGACVVHPWSGSVVIANGQFCTTAFGSTTCTVNPTFPIPSGANPIGSGDLTNVNWNGITFRGYQIPSECPGLSLVSLLIKI